MMCQLAVFQMISAQRSSVGRISADGAEGRAHDDARDSLITKGVSRRRYLGSGGSSWAALVPIAALANAAAGRRVRSIAGSSSHPRVDPVPVAHYVERLEVVTLDGTPISRSVQSSGKFDLGEMRGCELARTA